MSKKEIKIQIPTNLNLNDSVKFCNKLWRLGDYDKVTFDFNGLTHVEPFTMAYISTELQRFCSTRSQCEYFADNFEHHSYAAHMGFFKAFGLEHGNAPGEARGSNSYIPLTILKVEDLTQKAQELYEPVGNIIEQESNRLAKVLTHEDDGDIVDTLTYSFREIIRNVIEHSDSKVLTYCAQYWKTRHTVELVVLDSGIGIRTALSSNPNYKNCTDREAIQYSLLPAVSGKFFKGVKRQTSNVWQNSGFGLYMTNRLCRNGGSFFICSGNSGLLLNATGKIDYETSYQGTALRMVMELTNMKDLKTKLERFKKEGYDIASQYSQGTPIEASAASMMLSRDFR